MVVGEADAQSRIERRLRLWVGLGEHPDLVLNLADHLTHVVRREGGLPRSEESQRPLRDLTLSLNLGHPSSNRFGVGTLVQ